MKEILSRDKSTRNMVETVYRRQDKEKVFGQIRHQRLVMVLSAAGLCGLIFILCMTTEGTPAVIQDGNYIVADGETEFVTFCFQAKTEEGMAEEELTVDISPEEASDDTEEAGNLEPTLREKKMEEIRGAVEKAVEEQKGGKKILLPQTVSGCPVEYRNLQKHKDFSAFYLSLALLTALPFLWKKQSEKKLEERESQLRLDYPELVNRVVLLLSAGLTIRGCFERICEEYGRRLAEGGERRFVYEEVCVSCQEIKNGVPEVQALESFGRRCRQLPYLKFSSLVSQNMKKGSEGLTAMLQIEAVEALQERKEAVKRMGETAGTKLLFPMMLMLGVVMAIILVPAFMTL